MQVPSFYETEELYPDGVTPRAYQCVIQKCDFCGVTENVYGIDTEEGEFEDPLKSMEHICSVCLDMFCHLSGMTWSATKVSVTMKREGGIER